MLVSARESADGKPLMVAGPAGRLLQPADPHGAGRPRARRRRQARHRRPRRLVHRRSTSTSSSAAGATTRGARPRPARTTSTPTRCRPAATTCTTSTAAAASRSRCSSASTPGSRRRATARPAGTETLRALRTKLGIVAGRAIVARQAGAADQLRSTYFHEIDSLGRLHALQRPGADQAGPSDFQRAASDIGYTFNWFYTDAKHIAYFNSGANPRRPKGLDHNFPVAGSSSGRTSSRPWQLGFTPPSAAPAGGRPEVPRVVEQQAGQGLPRLRLQHVLLRLPLAAARGPAQAADQGQAEDDAGGDGQRDGARGLDRPARARRPAARAAGHRPARRLAPARARSTSCAHGSAPAACARTPTATASTSTADAIRLMDAWWPLWVRSQFRPALGAKAYRALPAAVELDNAPNNHGDHLGSAYQTGWYGFVRKDLRTVLKRKVRGEVLAQVLRRRQAQAAAGRCCGARWPPRSSAARGDVYERRRGRARPSRRRATSGATTRCASARSAAPPSR